MGKVWPMNPVAFRSGPDGAYQPVAGIDQRQTARARRAHGGQAQVARPAVWFWGRGMQSYEEQYLGDALALGDKHPVIATIAIYSHTGIKLVNPGTRVNSALYEKLVRHKLLPDIDQCLKVEGGVDAAHIAQCVKDLLVTNPRFERMTEAIPRDTILAAVYQAPLPAPLAFKLTMAREQRPQLFAHSIEVALVAIYLQSMNGQRISDLALAASAGLFHDIGILHISPEILAPGKALSDAGRRYLYTHPITAHLIVREFQVLNPVVSTAILEHHERLDGSGYPHGAKAEKLSELGKILMMADSGAALLKSGKRAKHGVALRLLRRKFSPLLLAHLSRLFAPQDEPPGEESASDQDLALRQLATLVDILLAWDNIYAELQDEHPESADDALLDLSNQRIVALERSLLEAGLVADQLEAFTSVSMQDEAGAQEMRELAREALWQLKDITFEVHRRWTEAAQPDAVHQAIARWLKRADERLTAV